MTFDPLLRAGIHTHIDDESARPMIHPTVADSARWQRPRHRTESVCEIQDQRLTLRHRPSGNMNSRFLFLPQFVCRYTHVLSWIYLTLWIFPLAVSAQTTPDDETADYPDSTSNTSIQYDDEADCPSCDIGGRIAGAVIGSLLCGFLLGAGLMYFYLKKFQNIYEEPVPPKDYDLPDTRLDVNRNDDSTYESSIPMGGDQAGIKNHKKLERLVKKPTQKTQEPIEIPSAATPLIHFYESPGEDNPGIVVTPSSTKSIVDDGGIMYSNTGAESLNTQPYESLDIIPEEVEYENSKFNNYEQMT